MNGLEEMSVAEEEIAFWLTSPAFFINLMSISIKKQHENKKELDFVKLQSVPNQNECNNRLLETKDEIQGNVDHVFNLLSGSNFNC